MAELKKIHPFDFESPPMVPLPSAPIAPDELLEFEKIELSDEAAPPPQQPLPPPRRRSRRKRSCLCRCFCWTLLAFIILVVLVGATIGILYLVFHPKIPKYSLEHLEVANFTIVNTTAAAVAAAFNLTITARNPNKKIGIYYKDGSTLSAWYRDYKLCSGSLPVFYQGHRNTTVMNVLLVGETELGGELLTDLQAEESANGTVALELKGRVPVRIKLGKLKLRKISFKVRCNLLVDSLTSGSVGIRSSSCKFRLKL